MRGISEVTTLTCFQFDSGGWNKDFLADTYAGVVYVTSSHGTLYATQMDGSEVKPIEHCGFTDRTEPSIEFRSE